MNHEPPRQPADTGAAAPAIPTLLHIPPELRGPDLAAWLCRDGDVLIDPITNAHHTDPAQLTSRTLDACLKFARDSNNELAFYARNLELLLIPLVLIGEDLCLSPTANLTQEQAQAALNGVARIQQALLRQHSNNLSSPKFPLSSQAGDLEPRLSSLSSLTSPRDIEIDDDPHLPIPQPDRVALYNLVGDLADIAAKDTEVNPFAAGADFMSFLSAQFGRDSYLMIGNTRHHCRLYSLHVGRSGCGRKGDALGLIRRVHQRLKDLFPDLLGQAHTGGLSSREGLVMFIHDGYEQGKKVFPAIADKRLWIVESEFANVLRQNQRDGNTLSSALRDAWDGVSIAPATKSNRIGASDPHVAISAGITPAELRDLISKVELTNGFAGRFLMFYAERNGLLAHPAPTPDDQVTDLAKRTATIIRFAKGDYPNHSNSRWMSLSPAANQHYETLYHSVLNQPESSPILTALLERRPAMLLRIAMLLALTDLTLNIEPCHIDAALAWVNYWQDSVRYLFKGRGPDPLRDVKAAIIAFLQEHHEVDRKAFYQGRFKHLINRNKLDSALDDLIDTGKVVCTTVEREGGGTGRPRNLYKLGEVRELREVRHDTRHPIREVGGKLGELRSVEHRETLPVAAPVSIKEVVQRNRARWNQAPAPIGTLPSYRRWRLKQKDGRWIDKQFDEAISVTMAEATGRKLLGGEFDYAEPHEEQPGR